MQAQEHGKQNKDKLQEVTGAANATTTYVYVTYMLHICTYAKMRVKF